MKKLILTLLIGTSLSLTAPAFAHGDEDHGTMKQEQGMAMPEAASPSDAMASIDEGYEALSKAASTGDYDKIHEVHEKISPALKSLADAHKDDAAITGTVAQIEKVLSALHDAGDAKDAAKVGTELKKLEGGIKLLKARMPAGMDHGGHEKHGSAEQEGAKLQAAVVGLDTLKVGEKNVLTLKLTGTDGKPVTLDQLQEVHTKKVHWLVADETLGDYHHLHPQAGNEPGLYTASFTPEKDGNYKVWVDITPAGATQQYIPVVLAGAKPCASSCVEKTISSEGESEGLKAILSFEKPLAVGEADMGKVSITDKDGKPVTDLEPVMGAFAHVVAFYDDFATVAHVHPMGEEPKSDTERGGPDLMFHLEPEKAGFLKIYVQVKRGGKDVFIPLGTQI